MACARTEGTEALVQKALGDDPVAGGSSVERDAAQRSRTGPQGAPSSGDAR